jgi:hypothetical protein
LLDEKCSVRFSSGRSVDQIARRSSVETLDLGPVDMECMRCRRVAPMRFYGLCATCREELHSKFDRGTRVIEIAEYEPKVNVTPNAVALKDD